ncbi:hypothetical protein [Streptomyces malaysiensis]|uniref:Uncharacterized protein n=1 Tax=Streptomyces malaysiensis TaxID=92644 RepID=A0A7X5X7F6_STRMQ|nr:hypothetical protein [Streptomyces malaysiensis]NIY68025.1 hypothetical protein [Streptomyces malaysiensis]
MPDLKTEAPAIFRGMLRDIIACPDYTDVCQILGLVPAGPEVDEAEHQQSHVRIEEFLPVAEDALVHADVLAEVLFQLTHMGECDTEDSADGRLMFRFVSRTAVSTVISHLLQKGALEIGDEA